MSVVPFGDGVRHSSVRSGRPPDPKPGGTMSQTPKRPTRGAAKGKAAKGPSPADFDVVLGLIADARRRALAAVNTALIDLYWAIGEHISTRVASAGWGQGTVQSLAEYIRKKQPNARGFSASNLWRMKQFVETYRD